MPAADDIETQAVVSDIPALILAGGQDVQTPLAWGMLADEALRDSRHVEFDALGHGLPFSGEDDCVTRLMVAFLDEPEGEIDRGGVPPPSRVDHSFDD